MHGLSVRWSLAEAPAGTAEALREYVTGTSLARFTGKPGLRFKTWRMRRGEWFEGTYVFDEAEDRETFEQEFRVVAATSPGSEIIGSEPTSIESFEVVAVAEGGAGFLEGPGPAG